MSDQADLEYLKIKINTPGTAGGPGGRDRALAIKSPKNAQKSVFFVKKIIITKKKLHIFSS